MVPALFLAHGSPLLAIQDNEYARFLTQLGAQYTPKAIVIFTAHWEQETLTVSYHNDVYDTIYDFYGFPEEMYKIKYPAKGSTAVADEVIARFEQQGIPVQKDTARGLDHGSWVLLRRMYPNADIPVVQISVHPFLPPDAQFKIGAALQGLGAEDILVIGSGVTVHNLRMIKWDQTEPEPWAVEFDDWLLAQFQAGDRDALHRYESLAPHARFAVPRPEHFVPLFLAAGAGDHSSAPQVIHRSYELGTLSYLSLAF
ncbi:4,5-DOPA dioxygenase extradiol [Tumebacillus sp. BK434]|uniref:DODA-type extradiol aromatic ring-opening family dioxygenase n=1 Tax=Tumebacillus sp. BK434 TaxID=2512169 RepID=UPI00104872D2|nr:class III extradiol ring-cleavage dioxygenase [Tumebacillus sp. BK434]TCP57951.1 4,5-DOPA dioxygenase extradiol [Tumebacillus sp. BK434]